MKRTLAIGSHTLEFPAFLPVTTFGGKFPLDELVRPYLSRFSPATMVSYHYAKQMKSRPKGLLFIDSGGFASLFEGSGSLDYGEYAAIRTTEGNEISPPDVLEFQEQHADIGATVDFVIPLNCPPDEALIRQQLTLKNAVWASEHKTRNDFLLYASIQAWDEESAMNIVAQLADHPFDGYALGGMVPRIQRPNEILAIVKAIRSADMNRPLHVFGIGSPKLIKALFAAGVDSIDSSSYVRAAVDGKYLSPSTEGWNPVLASTVGIEACHCPICRKFDTNYLCLEGEANRMALALHNLACLAQLTGVDH